LVFAASSLTIIPLADVVGEATEAPGGTSGRDAWGLLNATMSNAPELIINLFALYKGLIDIVKVSLCGALLGMLLAGMGISMFSGGIKHGVQKFNTKTTGLNASLLLIVTFSLIIPSVFHFSTQSDREISTEIAVVLFVLYLASLVATLIYR
jgi:Ca2+:H+ antiporter